MAIKNIRKSDNNFYVSEFEVIENRYALENDDRLSFGFDKTSRFSLTNESRRICFSDLGTNNEEQQFEKQEDRIRRSSQSAWTKWSQDRRVMTTKRQTNSSSSARIGTLFDQITQVNRTPTPIMKAREESKHLVAPEIVQNYLPQEPQKRKSSCIKGSRRGAISYQIPSSTAKLTYSEIQLLTEYWDHKNFVKSRKWGLCTGLLSLGLQLFSVCSSTWIYYGEKEIPNHSGLWLKCNMRNRTCSLAIQTYLITPNWLKSVIFLSIIGSLCNLLATFFGFSGVFVKHLPKKLYYYHSGSEFYCVASLSYGSGLLIFTLFSKNQFNKFTWFRYGYAYTLGWIGVLLSLTAFILLKLDEFIQEINRPIEWKSGLYKVRIPCLRKEDSFSDFPSTSLIAQNWRQLANVQEWS